MYLFNRNKYCIKEVSSLTQNLCGATQYFGDMYAGGQCVLKKCAAECVEETYGFEYEGQTYSRQRFCCNDKDFCNASNKKILPNVSVFALLFVAMYFVWQ
jgi:hypothetical protein